MRSRLLSAPTAIERIGFAAAGVAVNSRVYMHLWNARLAAPFSGSPTSPNFTFPITGRWLVAVQGGGGEWGGGGFGGGAGGLSVKTITTVAGASVPCSLAVYGNAGAPTPASTITLFGGVTLTANGGIHGYNGANGGTASGGDMNLTGGAGGASGSSGGVGGGTAPYPANPAGGNSGGGGSAPGIFEIPRIIPPITTTTGTASAPLGAGGTGGSWGWGLSAAFFIWLGP